MLYNDNKEDIISAKPAEPIYETGRYEKDPDLGLALVGDDTSIDERDLL